MGCNGPLDIFDLDNSGWTILDSGRFAQLEVSEATEVTAAATQRCTPIWCRNQGQGYISANRGRWKDEWVKEQKIANKSSE